MTIQGDYQAVVIGVSAGGFQALHTLLSMFSEKFLLPMIIVQHRIESEDNYLIESLNKNCALHVKEADDKETVRPGFVYIAPGGYHLLVEKTMTLSLSVDEQVSFARPSIDVLFDSAARAFQGALIGVVLTGANSDGSDGVKVIKQFGGLTIAEDPESSEVNTMPSSAIATGYVDFTMNLTDIPAFLVKITE